MKPEKTVYGITNHRCFNDFHIIFRIRDRLSEKQFSSEMNVPILDTTIPHHHIFLKKEPNIYVPVYQRYQRG